MNKLKTPRSLSDVEQYFTTKIWNYLKHRSLSGKIVLASMLVIFSFSLARINAFGDPFYLYARLLFPVQISGIDPGQFVIPFSLS